MYLGMETYGGEGGHFPEGTQTLADVLYYARQEQSNIGTVLTTIVRHSEKSGLYSTDACIRRH